MIEGTGTQSGNCGASSCIRWGDYSSMTLDQDGCTFWYTNMYYRTSGVAFNTRVGAFSFPGCTPALSGTLQGTVSASGSANPISGVTVALGSRTTVTDVNGSYSFAGLPSGTYPTITASFPGNNSITVANIVINDGLVTTQNFSLTSAATSGCVTDTTQADFQAGVPTNCDLTSSAGDVILINAPTIDQQNTTVTNSGFGFNSTSWGGQSFQAGVTGQLTRVDVDLFCSGCSGTTPNVTVSIRAAIGTPSVPTGADLATATITGFSSGAGGYYTANFSSPPTLTAGTKYAVILRAVSNPSAGTYAYVCSCTSPNSNPYSSGERVTSANSGSTWTADSTSGGRDLGFKVYVSAGFASSGSYVSSVKDSNPNSSSSANWGTISWTADTPSGTNVQFQAAASNIPSGPFTFVGPDGTAATFFSNGGSLTQFNSYRYLKYQAAFSTNSGTVTPTLHDVTICFSDSAATTLAVAAANGSFGQVANLSATLTAGGTGVSEETVSFTLNGNSVGSGVTDGSGIATVSNVSLAGINAGSYPGGIAATFAGDSSYTTGSGTAALTIVQTDQTITFDALSNKNFGDPDFAVSATASSTLAVIFSASGKCSVAGATVHLTGAGSCTITASQAGDSNYNPAADVPQTFSIAKTDQTIAFGALAGKIFGNPDFGVSATASSSLAVSFSAGGNCSVAGATVHLTAAGSCTITASQAGDSNYNPAPDVPQSFPIAKAGQTITFGALSAKTFGSADFAVSATASSSLAVSFAAIGNCSVAGSTVHLTGAGSCTIIASQSGDSNYDPASDVPQSLTINKALPLVTLSCPGADFDLNAHPCTAAATGIGNVIVRGTTILTYNSNPAPPANAGTYSVSGSFSSGDSNYADATGSGSLVITKATPTVSVTCPLVVYDGSTHTCTAAATGVGNAVVNGSLGLTYNGGTAPSAGGTYAVSANFTSGDSNYNDSTGIGSFIIAQAGQTITFGVLASKTLGDPDFAVSATASSSLVVSFSASGKCSVTGSTIHLTGAGSCTVTASQAGNANYNPATSVPRTFTINSGGDFTIAPTLPTVSVTAGQAVVDHITLTPNPATLTALTFTCSGLPAKASCTFAPNPVPAGSAPTDVIVTITTTATTRAALQGPRLFYANWLSFSGMGLIGVVMLGAPEEQQENANSCKLLTDVVADDDQLRRGQYWRNCCFRNSSWYVYGDCHGNDYKFHARYNLQADGELTELGGKKVA